MRTAGISNLYGLTNTAAMRRYHTTRNITRIGQSMYENTVNYTAKAASRINNMYENTKASAQNMRNYGQKLMNPEKSGLLARAAEKGSTKEVVSEVKNFVSAYNTMVKNMNQTGGTMNNLYASQLETSYNSHKEALADIGIMMGKDGLLKVNQSTLERADITDLKKAFGSTESFVGKATVKSIYVESNAVSEQISSQYARYGSYAGYGGYNGYGTYGVYSPYGGYGSGYSNLIGTLFNSLF